MWLIYALGASALWGLTYVLCERLYEKLSVVSVVGLTTFTTGILLLVFGALTGHLNRDLGVLARDQALSTQFAFQIAVFIAADLLIAHSIAAKNATLAGLIEISYPIFIALFAYVILKQSNFNTGTLVGGALIFSGVACVYWFTR